MYDFKKSSVYNITTKCVKPCVSER